MYLHILVKSNTFHDSGPPKSLQGINAHLSGSWFWNRSHIYIYIYTYIYIYIYIYIHTYVYIYIYICTYHVQIYFFRYIWYQQIHNMIEPLPRSAYMKSCIAHMDVTQLDPSPNHWIWLHPDLIALCHTLWQGNQTSGRTELPWNLSGSPAQSCGWLSCIYFPMSVILNRNHYFWLKHWSTYMRWGGDEV